MNEHDEIEDFYEPSIKKKIYLVIIGTILILLMISFIFTGYPLEDILQGKIKSSLLKDSSLDLINFSIKFLNNTDSIIKEKYFAEQKTEFSLCLLGKKKKEVYLISQIYQPLQLEQTLNHVTFKPCSNDSLILLHTHPINRCIASKTDINTLNTMKKKNSDILMIIMCGPNRFSIYS